MQYPEGKPVTTMKSATDTNMESLDSAEDIAELRTKVEQLRVQINEVTHLMILIVTIQEMREECRQLTLKGKIFPCIYLNKLSFDNS